jgi:hypothetical protein
MTDTPNCFAAIDEMIKECNTTARSKGFWDGQDYVRDGPAKIALMHSELSEALEAMRERNWDGPKGVTEELADTIIRIFDFCGQGRLPLANAILAKMHINKDRPYMHGGKAF